MTSTQGQTKRFEVNQTVFGETIALSLEWLGADALVVCAGGSKKHVGAVSLAWLALNDKQQSGIYVKTSTVPNHKDNILSQALAEYFCRELSCSVSAICGIHYDDATPEQVAKIVLTVKNLMAELGGLVKRISPHLPNH